jgi:hypothetical protein
MGSSRGLGDGDDLEDLVVELLPAASDWPGPSAWLLPIAGQLPVKSIKAWRGSNQSMKGWSSHLFNSIQPTS